MEDYNIYGWTPLHEGFSSFFSIFFKRRINNKLSEIQCCFVDMNYLCTILGFSAEFTQKQKE